MEHTQRVDGAIQIMARYLVAGRVKGASTVLDNLLDLTCATDFLATAAGTLRARLENLAGQSEDTILPEFASFREEAISAGPQKPPMRKR